MQRLLTRAVFRGGRVEGAIHELHTKALEIRDESAYLDWAAARLAADLGASRFEILGPQAGEPGPEPPWKALDYPARVADESRFVRDPRWGWAEAVVPIRLSARDVRCLLLGRRLGGRPYLSEDLRALSSLANCAAEEVERRRVAELERLASEAELRALHAQINPHFLFNALNTIYGIIPREAASARRTVLNLAGVFRYFLQSDQTMIPLSEELEIVRSYLEIEGLRLGSRLRTAISVDPEAERTLIPTLSIQPLVENAIKYGISTRAAGGSLKLTAKAEGGEVTISVEDSGSEPATEVPGGSGIGLANVTRRLQLCFGPDSALSLKQGPTGATVQFSVPLERQVAQR